MWLVIPFDPTIYTPGMHYLQLFDFSHNSVFWFCFVQLRPLTFQENLYTQFFILQENHGNDYVIVGWCDSITSFLKTIPGASAYACSIWHFRLMYLDSWHNQQYICFNLIPQRTHCRHVTSFLTRHNYLLSYMLITSRIVNVEILDLI